MFRKYLLVIFLFFPLYLSLSFSVSATRGCCSWHGGVCGCDTSLGRQICCDGTYSPSCTCAYFPQNEIYIPPPPPEFPSDTKAEWRFYSNENGTWNIKMKVLDINPTKYSAVINKCPGCDPGPLVDFYSNEFTFNNIKPGKWYVNVKKEINGYWSNVVYWTIDVPEWIPPTPTPTQYLFTSDFSNNNSINEETFSENNFFLKGLIGFIVGGSVAYFISKKI